MTWPHTLRAAAIGALLALPAAAVPALAAPALAAAPSATAAAAPAPAPAAAATAASDEGRALVLHGAGTVPACATCHGAEGQGNAAIGAPAVAGDGVSYLREQLANFAAGRRRNPIMQPIAAALSPAQRHAAAAYFAGLAAVAPPPAPAGAPADPRGARLAQRGDWAHTLPGCTQCHGPGGIGVPPGVPHLAGLTASYIVAQLDAFRSGARPPGPLGLMAAMAGKLSPADSAAVAAYFAGSAGGAGTGAGR